MGCAHTFLLKKRPRRTGGASNFCGLGQAALLRLRRGEAMRRPPVNGKNLQSNSGPRQKAGVRNNARNEMRCRAAGSGAGVLRTGGIGKSVPQRLHNHSFLSSLMNGAYHKVFSFAIGKFIILQNTYKRTYFRRAAPAPLVHNGEKISVIPTAKKYRKTQPADAEKCRL